LISYIGVRLRWLRKRISRTYWAARLLGITMPAGEADLPGLIILQLDGLSRTQFERAVEKGNLPFLAKLIRRRHFTVESFYSGIPSTTPAVQGEIFFGVRTAVPSFEFLRRKAGKVFRMYEAHAAAEIEADLSKQCPDPLLQGGHAYADIYGAGAVHSRYCSRDLPKLWKRVSFIKGLVITVLYAPKILRMFMLALLEFGLALFDLCKGLFKREDFLVEIAFVPARIIVCIIVREMIRFRMLLAIECGVQLIHANFLGYDEQAHRRGPESAFAHWTLKGIDRAVRDICRVASRSNYRDYEWMIHSDHGQEHSVPFVRKHGKEVDDALREVFAKGPLAGVELWMSKVPEIVGNTWGHYRQLLGMDNTTTPLVAEPDQHIIFTALGPVGHLYFPVKLAATDLDAYARHLVSRAGVPLVLLKQSDGAATAYNQRGRWTLPQDGAEVIGEQHPYLHEAAEDLARLCHHPDAGDLVVSGWDHQQPPLSFAMENGAHGGPGFEETRGFLLVPDRVRRWHVAHLLNTGSRVRGEDLRKIALHFLGRDGVREERVPQHPERDTDLPIRVMTYNIHSCIGNDGKVRPERVARVINHFDPDIVAVQEIDCHRGRSGGHDQAQLIADHLRMTHVFQAMFEEEKERYGIAIFARRPLKIVKAANLTAAKGRREARGAIWVLLEMEGHQTIHVINTHFGLGKREREHQAAELLGKNWLGAIPDHEPVILCGDFNSGPRSQVFRNMLLRFRDVQQSAVDHKPRPTFSSVQPILRIDHVFVSHHFIVEQVELPDTPTAVMASDHLPLCVELSLKPHLETT